MKKCSLLSLIKLLGLRSYLFFMEHQLAWQAPPSLLNFNYLITFIREESIWNFISYKKEKNIYGLVLIVYICSMKESSQGQIGGSESIVLKKMPLDL